MKIDEIVDQEVRVRKVDWNESPEIGWITENKKLTLYYGTTLSKIPTIFNEGIHADKTGYVVCALEPHTALAMSRIKNRKNNVVVVCEMSPAERRRLQETTKEAISIEPYGDLSQELYENWGKTDVEFYALSKARVPGIIPFQCVKGYIVKND